MRKVKLSLKSQARDRAARNLLSSLIVSEEIQTTVVKAKLLKSKTDAFFAKLASLDSLSKVRFSKSVLYGTACEKVLEMELENIKIFKLSNRFGDNAPMAKVILKLRDSEKTSDKKSESKEKTGGKK